ncbi:DUF5518 domain-containing protein [Halomicroarcula sp. GCM10025817]|uniref:DUF5518 domain-containing protein n=1 Tax=Haloarcula TaxID=2237 RepID=UPI0023E86BC1|nr:DUF5518 domain-containing protein [Halomicroarcula sp. SYNS111]
MASLTRQTLRNGAIGGVAGAAFGIVPIVVLVAPLLGGGIAGYLERGDTTRGAIAGAVAGVLMAALSTLVTGVVLFVRFGDLPFVSPAVPLGGLAIAAALSLLASLGQVVVASIGGALGTLLAEDRQVTAGGDSSAGTGDVSRSPGRHWAAIAASLVAGVVTFLAVALALTAVLDPFIWPSALVGLPIGFIAGTAVAVLGYRFLTRGRGSTIDWRTVGVGAVAVVVLFGLLVGGLSLLGDQRVDRTTESTLEYRVTLSADESLENATFYVPLPQVDGESALGEQFVESARYDRYVPAVEGSMRDPQPVNFTYDIVETDHGRMLAISAERIEVSRVYYREVQNETMGWRERIPPEEYDPSDPAMGVQHDGSFTFTVALGSNESIETADPFGTEPLLEPRYEQTDVECQFGRSDRHRCYEYESRVYAAYESPPNATVYVGTELDGRNEWFSGGWTGNEYRQRTAVELRGPGTGWYRTPGELEVGNGRYRD